MNVYIACGLTHVPRLLFDRYASFVHGLAAQLREAAGCQVKYALVDSDPQLANKPLQERARLCYLWDREMVAEADVVVAEASFPSTGMGIELQLAESKGTPVILCCRDFGGNRAAPVHYENPDRTDHELQIGKGLVSLMALGLPTVVRVIEYTSDDDGVRQIVDAVGLFKRD